MTLQINNNQQRDTSLATTNSKPPWLCDMKSDVVIVEIVWFGDFKCMFLGLDLVLYIWGYLFIVYITLIRLIVLCSWCRVNRSTNLSIVLYYVISFASTACLGLLSGAFPTCGVRPHYGYVHFTSLCIIVFACHCCNFRSIILEYKEPLHPLLHGTSLVSTQLPNHCIRID